MTQDFFVYLIVAAAVVYLVRMWWQSAAGKKGCDSCGSGGCAKAANATPTANSADNLIQIDLSGGFSSNPANSTRASAQFQPPAKNQ